MCANHLVVVQTVIPALNMPTKIPDFIIRTTAICNDMSRRQRYSASASKLAELTYWIGELVRIQTACKTNPPTELITTRNVVKYKVDQYLSSLRRDVHLLVLHDSPNARQIITEANMVPKTFANNKKFVNKVLKGLVEGSVILYAVGRGYHNWRMSTDNKTWINLDPTSTAKNILYDLEEGVKYYFQNQRVLTKGRKTAWSQSVSIRVV